MRAGDFPYEAPMRISPLARTADAADDDDDENG
jgi:hypothetical protein